MSLIQCFCFVLFLQHLLYNNEVHFSDRLTLEEVALTSHNIAFIKHCFCKKSLDFSFSSQQDLQV